MVAKARLAKFRLGQTVATPGALNALTKCGQAPMEFLARHVQGDWGVANAEDKASNDAAINDGDRIFSAYLLHDRTKIWVITESDRSSTCILLPEEY